MAAYLVKTLPWVGGATILSTGCLATVGWRKAYKLEKVSEALQADLAQRDRDCETLRRTIAWERDDKEKIKRALKWTEEEIERNSWTSKVIHVGLIGIGYAAGLMR